MAKISIVIPLYNGADYLAQTIDSVLQQTEADWELIIVDDGSKDKSAAIATRYLNLDGRIRLVRQENAGVAAARNRGLREMCPSSEYVILLDQDDLWTPVALEVLLGALKANPDAVAAYGLMHSIDARGQLCPPDYYERLQRNRKAVVGKRLTTWPLPRPTTFDTLVFTNVVVTPGQVLIRRRALETAGPFDSQAAPADDWDMWLRLTMQGDIVLLDKVTLYWRQHGSNVSTQRQRMNKAGRRVHRKFFDAPGLSPEQRRLVLVGYRWARRSDGEFYWTWARENMARGRWWSAAKQVRHALIELVHFYFGGTKLLPPG